MVMENRSDIFTQKSWDCIFEFINDELEKSIPFNVKHAQNFKQIFNNLVNECS